MGKILSLSTSKSKTGFWEKNDVSVLAVTPLNPNLALVAVDQIPGKRVILLSFLDGCDQARSEAECWARGTFGLIPDGRS